MDVSTNSNGWIIDRDVHLWHLVTQKGILIGTLLDQVNNQGGEISCKYFISPSASNWLLRKVTQRKNRKGPQNQLLRGANVCNLNTLRSGI